MIFKSIERKVDLLHKITPERYVFSFYRHDQIQQKLCIFLGPSEPWCQYKIWGHNGVYEADYSLNYCITIPQFNNLWYRLALKYDNETGD